MKTILFTIPLFILLTASESYGQDSARLFFKKAEFIVPINQESFKFEFHDSTYLETVLNIGNGKFFYVKQRKKDTLAVESGQLMLYKIANKFYLLREGIWVLENSPEKVLFKNLGKKGLLDEMQVQLQPFEYGGFEKPKGKTKKSGKHVN